MTIAAFRTARPDPKQTNNQAATMFDEFFSYTDGGLWTKVAASSGTLAWADTSRILLTTAATDNDTETLRSTNKNYTLTQNQGLFFEAYIAYTNQATTNANILAGFASVTVLTVTDGQAPAASYSGALIYKSDGGAVWNFQTSNGATKTTSVSTMSAVNGSYLLRIDIVNFDGSYAQAIPTVNGQMLLDANGVQIMHKIAYSGIADMYAIVQAAAGSANAQTCYVDYVTTSFNRPLVYAG